MSEADALATLERFADGDESVGHVCETAGAALLHNAARSYRAAMAAKGEQWPSHENVIRSRNSPGVEQYVLLARGFGFITGNQLRGEPNGRGGQFEFDKSSDPRCREIYDVMFANWEDMQELDRLHRTIQRVNGRDSRRTERLMARERLLYQRMDERRDALNR